MTNTYEEALVEANRLLGDELSDEALLEELGRRVQDFESGSSGAKERAQGFSGDFGETAKEMGRTTDFLLRLGQKWWRNLEPQLMALVCSPGNEDIKKITNNKSVPQLAAGLATAALTAAIAAPPAWVIIATTLLATKLAETGIAALCEEWAELRKTDDGRAPDSSSPPAPTSA